jgi:hypothetical protein
MLRREAAMYRIYGKRKTAKRMKSYDSASGGLCSNLIYATLYTDDQLEALEEEVEQMRVLNPDHIFTIRKVR